ncbi:hypothetical protein Tco_0496718 [Tanacetum coccineum]
MLLMQAQENGAVLDEEHLLFIVGGETNMFDDDVDEAPVQDLALNEDNIFQADQCDAFDFDVDEAPTAQTMFMANLSSADPIYDEVGPSYDLDILSEVQDHDNYVDSIGKYHEYVKDNAVPVVQSNVSSVPNDALMMIINDMHEPTAQCVSANEQRKVVNALLTAELARYKEQVELYERRARFELNEREQNIDEQLRIFITDQNMANENVPAYAPATSNEQILPFNAWVPIGKSNYLSTFNSFGIPLHRRQRLEFTAFSWMKTGDAIMDFVNELGYPEEIHFVSRMVVNNLYQPWRAILSMINQCLTCKTSGFDISSSLDALGSPFNIAEDDLSLGNLKFVPKGEEDEVFGMKIPKELITDNIRNAPYYNAYMEMVAKHDHKIASEEGGKKKSASKADQSKKPASAK